MDNHIETSTDRKVTLSCRVSPEQKLMLAERAKEMCMSLAQYVEAKVLRKDVFPLEKKIEEQYAEIERYKSRLAKMERDKNAEITQLQEEHKAKLSKLHKQIDQMELTISQNKSSLLIHFGDQNQLMNHHNLLNWLAEKYELAGLEAAFKICVAYTFENAKASFFLQGVSDFIKKQKNSSLVNKNL